MVEGREGSGSPLDASRDRDMDRDSLQDMDGRDDLYIGRGMLIQDKKIVVFTFCSYFV